MQIQVGKPSVWSMGQAHYLLASMRQRNRSLETKMPDSTALDPNAVNATSISILRTLLDIRGEYDQKLTLENAAARREEGYSLQRRDEARRRLAARQNELDDLQYRIDDIERKLARLRKEKTLRDAEREEDKTAMTAEDRARELRIAEMESTLSSSQAEKTRLSTEITALEKTASEEVGTTKLANPSIPDGTNAGTLPGLDSLQDYIRNSVGQVTRPSLSASIALDNFIGMQYEIIAKQLTLLRDEVGPNERIIFLELPASIYTVPDKADGLAVQLRWSAKRYYDSDPGAGRRAALDFDDAAQEDGETEYEKIEESLYQLEANKVTGQTTLQNREEQRISDHWKDVNPKVKPRADYVASVRDGVMTEEPELRRAAVRALDVIPRQSALNINETYSTASQKNFLGVLKLLSGIGVQVNYQRQRQLYEQYLQQEVFASGFGKGRDEFGWTFGPQPGTKRIAPGVRTTFAVLAVPRYASALELEVEGVAYPRKKSPEYGYTDTDNQLVTREHFVVRIPNEMTERFQIDNADYTPVKSGGSVSVKISGRNFSPQTGVLVNSVPLTRALALANNETADATSLNTSASGIHGAFELLSSSDIMLTFNMGDPTFVGTPTITLVTPEQTEIINRRGLMRINGYSQQGDFRPSFMGLSSVEPMFTESLILKEYVKERLGEVKYPNNPYTYIKGRLYGTGMLPGAEIEVDGRLIPPADTQFLDEHVANAKKNFINNHVNEAKNRLGRDFNDAAEQVARKKAEAAFNRTGALEDAFRQLEEVDPTHPREYVYQYSTGEYRIFARARNKNKFDIRYKHKTATGFDVATYKYVNSEQPLVRRYVAEADAGHSLIDLRLYSTIPKDRLQLSLGTGEGTLSALKYEGDNSYRAIFLINDEDLGVKGGKPVMAKRDTITITVEDSNDANVTQWYDVPLPVQPTIAGIVNPSTGKAEGGADEEPVVTISGRDLQQVKHVFFGEQEAAIVGGPSFDSIEVQAPKRASVPDGEKVVVTVRVVTGANKVSAATQYTFTGKPKPPPASPQPQPTATPPKAG